MKKRCTVCKLEKSISEFGINNRMKDGIGYVCKKCKSEYQKNHYKNRTPVMQAKKVFSGIEKRCTNAIYHEHRPKYKTVKNLLNRNEFILWYTANHFEGCEVDRIDDNGHYDMSNIQLLSREEHNHKRKLERDGDIEDGFKKCNRCAETKPETIEFFNIHTSDASEFNPLGLRGICKACGNKQRREYYQQQKSL